MDLGGREWFATASPSHYIQSRLYISSSNANDWVSCDEAFKMWTNDADCRILQLCGSDGSGKTTLMHFLIKHLERSSTVLFFFCTCLDDSRQSAKDILLSMVNQLLFPELRLYNDIKGFLSGNENSLRTKEDIWTAFRILISRPRKQDLVCFIDDIDECKSAKWLLEQFVRLQEELDIPFKVVISSKGSFTNDTLSREQHAGRLVKVDLEVDVDGMGGAGPNLSRMRSELVGCAEKATMSWISDLCCNKPVYRGCEDLLSSLYRQHLFERCGVSLLGLKLSFGFFYPPGADITALSLQKQVEEILADTSLETVYEKLLQKVNADARSWARNVLQWICYASRPLTTAELSIALATEFQLTTEEGRYFGAKGEYSLHANLPLSIREQLIRVFGPLIEFDQEEIHPVHQSFHASLVDSAKTNLPTQGIEPRWYRLDEPEIIHEHIFNVSLKYLTTGNILQSFVESKTLENDLDLLSLVVSPDRKLQGFLRYASKYWPKHYVESKNLAKSFPGDGKVIDFLRGSLAPFWYQIYQLLEGSKERHPYDALSVIAKLGFSRIVHSFLDTTETTLPTASHEWEGLVAMAAKHGHCTVVQHLLLKCPPEVNLSKALLEASSMGFSQVVCQLLSTAGASRLAQLDLSTALCSAACKGHEMVTRKLLEHKAPILQPGGNDALTPLQYAAKYGQERVVRSYWST